MRETTHSKLVLGCKKRVQCQPAGVFGDKDRIVFVMYCYAYIQYGNLHGERLLNESDLFSEIEVFNSPMANDDLKLQLVVYLLQ